MIKKTLFTATGGLGLLLAADAFANPIYQVFFDGGGVNAGSVVALQGAQPLPDGACGMRVSGADLLYDFYWTEYNAIGLGDPMPEPPWGPPSSATYDFPDEALEAVIEFTGPLAEGCEDEWVFHLPLAGDWPVWLNGTPSGAGALVFNVTLPNDIEWLESGFQVWEPPGEDPGDQKDPEFPSICELWPDLCEEPELTYSTPCHSLIADDLCNAARQIDEFAQRAERLVQIAVLELHSMNVDRRGVAQLETAAEAVRLALADSAALAKIALFEPPRDTAIRSSAQDVDPAGKVKAHLGFAEIALRDCRQHIDQARASAKRSVYSPSEIAAARCAAAGEAFAMAGGEVRKLNSEPNTAKKR